jgi:hypothetical protein
VMKAVMTHTAKPMTGAGIVLLHTVENPMCSLPSHAYCLKGHSVYC